MSVYSVQSFFMGLQDLLVQGLGGRDGGSPASVWIGNLSDPFNAEAVQAGNVVGSGVSDVRLANTVRGEVYVYFEGPLGAQLKPEESKKEEEEEERRRYPLIPRTFTNWLQVFAILASVIGKKHPEHCSALFCYLDAIGDAYRTYGGIAWLRYDEQLRQR